MAEGLVTKEIADRLGLTKRTVETVKHNFFKKVGADNAILALTKLYRFVPRD